MIPRYRTLCIICILFFWTILTNIGCSMESGYKAVFLSPEQISNDRLNEWLASCTGDTGYYEYISSDPLSWDIFLYYTQPDTDKVLDETITLKYSDSVLTVFVNHIEPNNEQGQINHEMLVYVKAPEYGAWPTESRLVVDGEEIACIGRDYQD